jgi:hypothetical protein
LQGNDAEPWNGVTDYCSYAPGGEDVSVALHKPDAALLRGLGRSHELADGLEDAGDRLVVDGELALQARFQLIEPFGELLVCEERVPQLHKCAHDVD